MVGPTWKWVPHPNKGRSSQCLCWWASLETKRKCGVQSRTPPDRCWRVMPLPRVPLARGQFREAFNMRRCLIPADGFYEWQRAGKAKQPYCFEVNNGELFAFAGLWDRWKDARGQKCRIGRVLVQRHFMTPRNTVSQSSRTYRLRGSTSWHLDRAPRTESLRTGRPRPVPHLFRVSTQHEDLIFLRPLPIRRSWMVARPFEIRWIRSRKSTRRLIPCRHRESPNHILLAGLAGEMCGWRGLDVPHATFPF